MLKNSQCNVSLLLAFSFFSFVGGWNTNQLRAEELPNANEAGSQLNLEKWPYKLTQEQITLLQSIGCTFSKDDLEVAQRLNSRGFSAEEYIQAYVETNRIRPGVGKQYAESMAIFLYLGLPLSEFSVYVNSGYYSMTDYYNSRIGGRGNIIAGWIVAGSGIGTVLSGVLYYALSKTEESDSRDTSVSDAYKIIGYTMMGVGGLMVLIGLPIAIVGHSKTSHWAPSSILDTGTKTDMQPYRLSDGGSLRAEQSSSVTGPQWALAPYYSKDKNWGLVFALEF